MIGSTVPPKDVAIASVKAPESVFKGDIASVEVVVKADGIAGVDVPVTLERPGGSPLKQVVRGQPDGSRPVVTFRVPMEDTRVSRSGRRVGPLVGDARPDNDRRTITIQVADDKARVLLVDGEARWEFRYLHNALKRDPRVAVEAVVFRQPRFGRERRHDTRKLCRPTPRPEEADPLGAYDAIFVGDVEPALMPSGSLVAIGIVRRAARGDTDHLSRTAGLAGGDSRAWKRCASSCRCSTRSRSRSTRRPLIPAHPSLAAGRGHRAVAVGRGRVVADAPARCRRRTEPGRVGGPASLALGPGGPGQAGRDRRWPRSRGSDSASDGAVIAAQPYGLGKVLWVGTDATWRWRFRVGDAYHHRFWGQVVRWAAAGKLAAGNALVRFGPDRSKVPEGESVRLRPASPTASPASAPTCSWSRECFKAVAPQGRAPKAEGEASP